MQVASLEKTLKSAFFYWHELGNTGLQTNPPLPEENTFSKFSSQTPISNHYSRKPTQEANTVFRHWQIKKLFPESL